MLHNECLRSAARYDLRAVKSPRESETEEIRGPGKQIRKVSRANHETRISRAAADKNDKVSKVFVPVPAAVPSLRAAPRKPTFAVSSHEAARFF